MIPNLTPVSLAGYILAILLSLFFIIYAIVRATTKKSRFSTIQQFAIWICKQDVPVGEYKQLSMSQASQVAKIVVNQFNMGNGLLNVRQHVAALNETNSPAFQFTNIQMDVIKLIIEGEMSANKKQFSLDLKSLKK